MIGMTAARMEFGNMLMRVSVGMATFADPRRIDSWTLDRNGLPRLTMQLFT